MEIFSPFISQKKRLRINDEAEWQAPDGSIVKAKVKLIFSFTKRENQYYYELDNGMIVPDVEKVFKQSTN